MPGYAHVSTCKMVSAIQIDTGTVHLKVDLSNPLFKYLYVTK